jgi:hypothetical protein
MSSGIAYPPPTYIPILSVFNPLFFPQSFGTTTSSGGGSFTNIFPLGLESGNVITMNGGTGGAGGIGAERTITGLSQIEWVDYNSTNPTAITGYMVLNGNTLNIGSASNSTGINVNLQGTSITSNGVAIGGGNVYNSQNNNFQSPATTQTFSNQIVSVNGGSIRLQTSGSLYPITITNNSSSSADNELVFAPNIFQDAGTYIFQTYESGYVNRATIDYTGLKLVGTPFKSNLNTTPTLTQLPTGYSCFYSNATNPYFAYNNAGTITTKSLFQTTILGTFTSSIGIITSGIINWSFTTIPNNTLPQQFGFLIVCSGAKSNANSPYLTQSLLQLNSQITNAMSVSGNAILLPFQFSNGATPVPIITNTSGYVLTAYNNIGGLTLNSRINDASNTGVEYEISANVSTNPFTAGSTLTLYAYTPLI